MIYNGNDNVVMFRAPSGPCLLINTRHAGDIQGLLLIVTKALPPLHVHCH